MNKLLAENSQHPGKTTLKNALQKKSVGRVKNLHGFWNEKAFDLLSIGGLCRFRAHGMGFRTGMSGHVGLLEPLKG